MESEFLLIAEDYRLLVLASHEERWRTSEGK